jgi:putative protein-disulfide isomerase
VQRAFYAEAVDVTDPDVYTDLVAHFPVDPESFVAAIRSPEMLGVTDRDFQEAQWLGVTGFPTLLLRDGTTTVPMSLGYAPFESVAERLNMVVEENYADVAGSLVCDIDGGVC